MLHVIQLSYLKLETKILLLFVRIREEQTLFVKLAKLADQLSDYYHHPWNPAMCINKCYSIHVLLQRRLNNKTDELEKHVYS